VHRLIPILDAGDERLGWFRRDERALASRAQRRIDDGDGWFLAEGDLVVERSLTAGCVPVAAVCDPLQRPAVVDALLERIDVYEAGAQIRRMVTQMGRPLNVVAVFERPPRPSAEELAQRCRRIIAVEAVDNPANIGSIVRNGAALGWDGLLLDHTSADPLARRSLRVAMGTAFSLPHARTSDLRAALMAAATPEPHGGAVIIAMTPSGGAVSIDTLRGRLDPDERRVLLIGSERDGLSAALLEVAHHRVRIPMAAGVDSINVAAATAIACHLLG